MSLILDALNRSQRERENDRDVPGIETQHWVDPQPYSGRWQRSLPWVALLIALGVIAWLLIDNGEAEIETVAKVALVGTTSQRQPGVEVKAVTMPIQASVPAPVAVAKKVAVEPASNSTRSVSDNPVIEGKQKTADTSVSDLYQKALQEKPQVKPTDQAKPTQAVPQKSSTSEQVIDIEKMIALAKKEAHSAELAEHSAPFLSTMSQQTKDGVPTLYYTQHDYSSNTSQSSVTLNGKVVKVGGSVAGKLRLVEILPNSIVLNQQGVEFRLRALNSWINL